MEAEGSDRRGMSRPVVAAVRDQRHEVCVLFRILGEAVDMSRPSLAESSNRGEYILRCPAFTCTMPRESTTDLDEKGFGRSESDHLRRPHVWAAWPWFGSADRPWTCKREFP